MRNHLESLPELSIDYMETGGHGSMLARPIGVQRPEILLCGHLDVIEHSQPDCYRSHLADGRIYGPGSGDMKGQIAILIELMRASHARWPGISLGLALTSDEERGGSDGVRHLCEDMNLRCGVAIVPDGGSLNDVTIEEKGVLHLRVAQDGHEAHGARPWLGENAVEQLLARLMRLRRHFDRYWPEQPVEEQVNHWFPTCCINIVSTDNTTTNRIPDQASATLDIRFPPTHTVDSMLAEVTNALGAGCRIEPLMSAEPTHLDADPLFVQLTEQFTEQPVRLVRASGASDSRFFRKFEIPVILSRPLVGNLHATDEWIDIDSMATYYRICEAYIRMKLKR
ncbi:MAG: M20 family metallopeptidase [Planctomycetales bacterium]|nr:M20 family metallopeptidase [Planctomycetales bacterium]